MRVCVSVGECWYRRFEVCGMGWYDMKRLFETTEPVISMQVAHTYSYVRALKGLVWTWYTKWVWELTSLASKKACAWAKQLPFCWLNGKHINTSFLIRSAISRSKTYISNQILLSHTHTQHVLFFLNLIGVLREGLYSALLKLLLISI